MNKELLSKVTLVAAFIGPKVSGKTTACDYVAEKYGGKVLTFAGELKKIVKEAFELKDGDVYKDKDVKFPVPIRMYEKHFKRIVMAMDKKLTGINPKSKFNWRKVAVNKYAMPIFETPRQILQWVGTEMMHSVYQPFHCEVLESQINGKGLYLIDDLRFVSEFEHLKTYCPILYVAKIIGRKEVQKGQEEHASEADWKNIPVDMKVDNSKSLVIYKEQVDKIFEEIVKKVEDKMSEEPNVNLIVSNILGDIKNAEIKGNTVRNGRFIFERTAN